MVSLHNIDIAVIIISYSDKKKMQYVSSRINHILKNYIDISYQVLGNKTIDFSKMAKYTKKICFGFGYNQPIKGLPRSVESIHFGYDFNQMIYEYPSSLKYLYFDVSYNMPTINLPKCLKKIKFGHKFNQYVEIWPEDIEEIIFGFDHNQPIDNLPNKLKKLTLGFSFNKKVNRFPEGLKELALGENFCDEITSFPPSLKVLDMECCWDYNHNLNNLPSSLRELILCPEYSLYDVLPHGLVYLYNLNLCTRNVIDNLPKSLISVTYTRKVLREKILKVLPNAIVEYSYEHSEVDDDDDYADMMHDIYDS